MSLLNMLRERRYRHNPLVQDVLKIINDSHNYVKVRVTPTYVDVEYWIKEPKKQVKDQLFFFDDYDLKEIKHPAQVDIRNYLFIHMELQSHHMAYNDEVWHAYDFDEAVPCIYPKTR